MRNHLTASSFTCVLYPKPGKGKELEASSLGTLLPRRNAVFPCDLSKTVDSEHLDSSAVSQLSSAVTSTLDKSTQKEEKFVSAQL